MPQSLKEQLKLVVPPVVKPFFTKRQVEIAELLAEGLTLKMVAGRLKISEKTVKNHVFGRFETTSRDSMSAKGIFGILEDATGKRPGAKCVTVALFNAGALVFPKPTKS